MTLCSLTSERAVISVEGPEARTFLQNLITCSVDTLDHSKAAWGALLTPQGRIKHDFLVFSDDPNRVYLDCWRPVAQELLRDLTMYRLRSKLELSIWPCDILVCFSDLDDSQVISYPDFDPVQFHFFDPRDKRLGVRCYLEHLPPNKPTTAPLKHWHRSRLALGLPDTKDLIEGRRLPLEFGLDAFGGIAWQKGCYVGQEVTARMKHRSLLKRHVVPIRLNEVPSELSSGATLLFDTHKIGQVIAIEEDLGLALIGLEWIRPNLKTESFEIPPLHAPLKTYLESLKTKE